MPELKRVLRLRTVVTNSAGITFATTSFIAAAQVAGYVAGDSAWIAVLVAGLLTFLVAASFAELNGLFPSAAALRVYLQRGFRDDLALTVSFLYVFVVIAVLGAEAYVLAQALHTEIPAIPPLIWIGLLLLLAAILNIRGIEIAGAFQDFLTIAVVASIFLFSYLAASQAGWKFPHLLAPGGLDSVLQAAAVGVFLFVGFEWVTPLAEEVTQDRLIAQGMYLAVAILTAAYAVLTLTMGHLLTRAELASPVPQILFALKVLGHAGALWMLGVSLGASATTFNAGLTAASRFLYATAREGSLPKALARIDMRTFTPTLAIWILFAASLIASVLVYGTRSFHALVDLGAAMESIVYTLAPLAVLRLRKSAPERPRPYRAWGAPWVQWFTSAVFALLALAAAVDGGLAVPVLLLVGGAASYLYATRLAPQLRAAARRAPSASR